MDFYVQEFKFLSSEILIYIGGPDNIKVNTILIKRYLAFILWARREIGCILEQLLVAFW